MKLNFDETGATKQQLSSITFTDYPNGSYTASINGYYISVVYSCGDTICLKHNGDDYWVCKIQTADGLIFEYDDPAKDDE